MGQVAEAIKNYLLEYRGYQEYEAEFEEIEKAIMAKEKRYIRAIELDKSDEIINDIEINLNTLVSRFIPHDEEDYRREAFKIVENIKKALAEEDFINTIRQLHQLILYLLMFSKETTVSDKIEFINAMIEREKDLAKLETKSEDVGYHEIVNENLNHALGDLVLLVDLERHYDILPYTAEAWLGTLMYVWWSLNILEQEEKEEIKG